MERAFWVFSLLLLSALGLVLYPRLRPPSPEAVAQRAASGGTLSLPPGTWELPPLDLTRPLVLRGAGPEATRLRLRGTWRVFPGVQVRLEGLALEGTPGVGGALLRVAPGGELSLKEAGLRCEGCQAVLQAAGKVQGQRVLLDGGGRGAQVVLALEGQGEARLEEARLRAGVQACLLLEGSSSATLLGGEVGPSGHAGLLVLGAGRYRLEGVAFRDNPTAAVIVLGEGAEGRLEGVRVEGGRYALYLGEKAPAPVLGAGNVFHARKVVERLTGGSR